MQIWDLSAKVNELSHSVTKISKYFDHELWLFYFSQEHILTPIWTLELEK